jgi:hypothetical protein
VAIILTINGSNLAKPRPQPPQMDQVRACDNGLNKFFALTFTEV